VPTVDPPVDPPPVDVPSVDPPVDPPGTGATGPTQ
jgi:hypothetical protein